MRIVLIGAPGAGKTHIAQFISSRLGLAHIEGDQFFWKGLDLREEVKKRIQGSQWIMDGHVTKVHDLVFPLCDKVIVIEGFRLKNLCRSLKRDWINPLKAWFNIQNYEKMTKKREDLVEEILKERKEDVLFLNNFSNLSECELTAFCKLLKASPVKAK